MKTLLRGWIADGIADEVRKGALLIDGERIAGVEAEINGSCAADRIIDFRDEIIAPGFIDVHAHSDLSLLAYPDGFSKRRQGVTCEIVGNCGLSVFPVTGANAEHLRRLYAEYPVELSWCTLPEYREALKKRNTALRTFSLCGHNTLRAAVAGYEKERLTAAEIARMGELLADALDTGAVGLSTGLLYVPGCFSTPGELLELMKILSAHDRVYTTHLRSEGDSLLESIEECCELALRAGLRRVEISHFKTAGEKNWNKLDAALELFDRYRRAGIDLHIDRYPYVESQTMLSVTLPPPWKTMGDAEITEKLAVPGACESLLESLRRYHDDAYWKRIRLTGSRSPRCRSQIGKKICEITDDPAALVVELLAFNAPSATMGASVMSEENLTRILALDYCCCGSDGNALPPDESSGRPHPRAFGSAARFMRRLLDSGVKIGRACRRISGMPSEFFRLPETGTLKTGNYADLTVFDPEQIDSRADFAEPCLPAEGIAMTMLAGRPDFY